ncbi:MAG: hypothetical protein NZM65_00825 [Flavobacteriales bacterium]|nr:hypothetical protein [Flavobacteriales bacterium]MDW8409212.1 hypothetical protein [Flavobacteriales bacterium]
MARITVLFTALLACAVKFAIAYPTSILTFNFSFLEAVAFGVTGGGLGVFAFTYAGTFLVNSFNHLVKKLKGPRPAPRRPRFTPGRRRLVRIKQKYGLWGIAFLSPVLISIPIGCLVAVRYFHNRRRILFTMMASVLFWSVVMAAFRNAFISLFKI